MLRTTITRLQRHIAKRGLATPIDRAQAEAHKLAEEALEQKVASMQRKATLPKGTKKPAKATGQKDSQWKLYVLTGGALTTVAVSALLYYGQPFHDNRDDEYASEHPLLAAYHRCVKKIYDPMWEKLLPDPVEGPFRRPYTLVINLDDTLIHSTWDREHGWRHAKRPGVDFFLSYMSQFYEIVIFTSQSSMNAIPILDKLDPYQYALYRLYREATRYIGGKYVKDLRHLNRDLNKVIIMDSNPDAFSLQPENGIALKPWKGEANDNGLLSYIPFLEAIAFLQPDDIRPVLARFKGENIPEEWARQEQEMNRQHILQWENEQAAKKQKRNLGTLFGPKEEKPPLLPLDQMRKQAREAYAAEHEQMVKQERMIQKEIEEQKRKMGEMKLTVWDMMTQLSTGQPIMPPGQEQPLQQQQQQQQPQK
ncbi:mitochondrial inner membrane protein required for protein import [Apophysomyces ossiformis]|uniref:Mitochondrial import inner membrane translocase subunit TIM50 n=1 Tax=Apophysomyces ossiformis TaxID=679940 RepID=A0A8H7BGE8_9FUNG|nr:mitochondrial inner membrane protein required for protein import [Apophysomyces ossiformis]